MSNTKKIKDPDPLCSVAEFHRQFDLPVPKEPGIPSEDRCRLRINLIREELEELEEAIEQKDLIEVADAFCDLQYVLSGAILEFGLGYKFKKLFEEVQRSNMSKACDTEKEAEETLEYYMQKDGTKGFYRKVDDHYLVYRSSDHKVLKNKYYSPADFEPILSS